MTNIALKVENLGKKYLIRHQNQYQHGSLREALANGAKTIGKRITNFARKNKPKTANKEEFWALKNISFELKVGEKLGIIGHNGAGKSTLLKLLSRITVPTTGKITTRGRVASLLEVGTGFHHELTGRENVFLNGAMLGMSKREIGKKFEQIVAFSEVEKFIDTPVKRYSSGMQVRLGFAVAAHLDPDILLLDEVLTVGDVSFQQKCLAKMDEATQEGRTVLFISHNMGIMREFVKRGIVLKHGKISFAGAIDDAITKYLSSDLAEDNAIIDLSNYSRVTKEGIILRSIACKNKDNKYVNTFSQQETIYLEITYQAPQDINLTGAEIHIYTADGIAVGHINTYMTNHPPHNIPQQAKLIFTIPAKQFTHGSYLVTVMIGSHIAYYEDVVEKCIGFTIHQADIYETGYMAPGSYGVATLRADNYFENIKHQ